MTKRERIQHLEREVAELRKQLAELAIAVATRPPITSIPMPAPPAPPLRPPSVQPPPGTLPPFSPNMCQSSGPNGMKGATAYNSTSAAA